MNGGTAMNICIFLFSFISRVINRLTQGIILNFIIVVVQWLSFIQLVSMQLRKQISLYVVMTILLTSWEWDAGFATNFKHFHVSISLYYWTGNYGNFIRAWADLLSLDIYRTPGQFSFL